MSMLTVTSMNINSDQAIDEVIILLLKQAFELLIFKRLILSMLDFE